MKHAAFVFLSVVCAITAACQNGSNQVSTKDARLSPQEYGIVQSCEEGLKELAGQSQAASKMYDFYRAHAHLATVKPDGRIIAAETVKQNPYFFICVVPSHLVGPDEQEILAHFHQENSVLELYPTRYTPFAKGLLLIHEMQHIGDYLYGVEPRDEYPDLSWLAGEWRANGAVNQTLNELTQGQWNTLVQASLADRQKYLVQNGHPPTAFTLTALDEDSVRIGNLFPSLKSPDYPILYTQVTFDANVMMINQAAGQDSLAWQKGMTEFLTAIYGRALRKTP